MPDALGNRNAFKRVVEWGDGWIPNRTSVDEIQRGRAILNALADQAGRDPHAIEVMAFGRTGQCRDRAVMQELEDAGANHQYDSCSVLFALTRRPGGNQGARSPGVGAKAFGIPIRSMYIGIFNWQSRTHKKGALYRTPTIVRPDERRRYACALAPLAMSSSQGPGMRPRLVPPIM